jgi:hypothetical protein
VLEIRRSIWVVEIGELPRAHPDLPPATLTGGARSYPACRREARRLRERGTRGLTAPAAALLPGGAHGWRVDGGMRAGPGRDGRVVVLFGARPDLLGWEGTHEGRPSTDLLGRVRRLASARRPRAVR